MRRGLLVSSQPDEGRFFSFIHLRPPSTVFYF